MESIEQLGAGSLREFGEGDSNHGDSDELRSAKGSFDDEGNSRPRFLEFNQRTCMKNVQLMKALKFASHVVFKEALI